jgi:hypothetical protein
LQSTDETGPFPVERARSRVRIGAAIAHGQADWYAFVLQELNGLGTMLRFRGDGDASLLAGIQARIGDVLETLAWDAEAALKQTWAFIAQRLDGDAFDDAWGPYVALRILEPDGKRVAHWLADLGQEARAVIEETPDVFCAAVADVSTKGSLR